MTGTDKQQTWAMDIQATTLAQIATMRQQVAAHPTATDAQRAARMHELDAATKVVESQMDSTWWIDRCHVPATERVREAYRMSRQ